MPGTFANELRWHTPARWAKEAYSDVHALLSDHAYLERKAASNALDLLNRWPEPGLPVPWVDTVAAIAQDEANHLVQVLRLLAQRNGHLARNHKSDYAAGLRELVRRGRGKEELLDRVLISGLIELRSFERFELLSEHGKDPELCAFYKALAISESGHYKVYLQLGKKVLPRALAVRWSELLDTEAKIIQRQAPGPGIHSGVSKESKQV